MCNSKKDTLAVDPRRTPRTPRRGPSTPGAAFAQSSSAVLSTSFPTTSTVDTSTGAAASAAGLSSYSKPSSSSASSGHLSSASLREFLPESPNLYDFSEICSATNNFLAKRLSSSSSNSWRCTLRGKDAVVFQHRFHGDPPALRRRLAVLSKIHHSSIIRLLGAALGSGDHVYLVYEHVNGASLADCLRNPRNPGYTPLVTWVDRMQVAADLAQGLQYIHHFTDMGTSAPPPSTPRKSDDRRGGSARLHRPVHNRIKSSSVLITERQHRAKICHFGVAELSGEIPSPSPSPSPSDSDDDATERKIEGTKVYEVSENSSRESPKPRRSGSRNLRFEGERGYIAPEIRDGGSPSQESDVFAFGVVLLELLAGEEPLKYRYNRETKGYEVASLIETAREVMGSDEGAEEEDGEVEVSGKAVLGEERHRRIRRWVDQRLSDSFPVEVAERAVGVALECVRTEAERRPDMLRVAGKLSRLLLQSRTWAEKLGVPAEFTVSMGPR